MTMVASRQRTFADATSLLSDASRATMLLALLDGRAYTASELAQSANISPQAASFHLKRLVSANLLDCVSQGRHRYFRLAGADVAQLLECLLALDQIAHPRRIETSCPDSLRNARTCYNHIAGRAGVHLYRVLLRKEWVTFNGPLLALTAAARELMEELAFPRHRSSPVGKPCLDWSEREFHIAGELGIQFFNSMLACRWFLRGKDRSLILTEQGRNRLAKYGLHPWSS